MRRARRDVLWFVAAGVLLAAGVVGWWADGTDAGGWGFGYGQAGGLMLAVWCSGAIILLAWWRRAAAPDVFDAPLMGPLALAASAPLSMLPLIHGPAISSALAGVTVGLAAFPLAWLLTGRIADAGTRRRTRLVVVMAVAGASWFAWWMGIGEWNVNPSRSIRWVLIAIAAVLPAVVLATSTLRGQGADPRSAAGRILESLAVLGIGVAPAVTGLALLFDRWEMLVLPAVAVLATLLVIGRFALRPLVGLAGAAQTQRDRVVAAADQERMRLASVLHDGPLADITLLIQRLDDRGDAGSAAIARSIATELRAIGSELRLPVLDDLGTGPALEWLVGRLAARSGAAITLDQHTFLRPPAPVELAMYRVAQEALVNALKHAAPPIRVSYRATAEGAEVRVDDSGQGIAADAVVRADRDGSLGLPSMAQRAEVAGARLTIATRAEGGTRVTLVWRAPVPAEGLGDATGVPPSVEAVRVGT